MGKDVWVVWKFSDSYFASDELVAICLSPTLAERSLEAARACEPCGTPYSFWIEAMSVVSE